ncbi:MAG: hypothetical protein HY720_32130 [Planctomycetes bacterium]|nr:hypothetical protein [Planctomycetota bacterium]
MVHRCPACRRRTPEGAAKCLHCGQILVGVEPVEGDERAGRRRKSPRPGIPDAADLALVRYRTQLTALASIHLVLAVLCCVQGMATFRNWPYHLKPAYRSLAPVSIFLFGPPVSALWGFVAYHLFRRRRSAVIASLVLCYASILLFALSIPDLAHVHRRPVWFEMSVVTSGFLLGIVPALAGVVLGHLALVNARRVATAGLILD